MNQWLANNQDAIAVAIIVLMILAGDAGTFEAVSVVGLPDLLREAPCLAAPLPVSWQPESASIHKAAGQGALERVTQLVASRSELLNLRNQQGRTPLLKAVLARQWPVATFLIEKGADVNAQDGEGKTALLAAAFFGETGVVKLILARGGDAAGGAHLLGFTPLHLAARAGHKDIVELQLARGAPLEARDQEGRTPLATAAAQGQSAVLEALLARGASLEASDRKGSTPLLLAALGGHLAEVKTLLTKGASVNARNSLGSTPLSVAAREGYSGVAGALRATNTRAVTAAPPALEGDYLGQKPPGLTAERFAPGVVSTESEELNSVFTPDGAEFYFTVARGSPRRWTIKVMKRTGNRWGAPEVASFSGTYSDVDLCLSHDGRKLLYCSNRPLSGRGEPKKDFDIWMVERAGDGWSEPRRMGGAVNTEGPEFYPSLTRTGLLYFQRIGADGHGAGDIYFSRLEEGGYPEVENAGGAINTQHFESDPFISPGGDYLIFSSNRPGGFGQGDLNIAFRAQDGSWTPPRNMGRRVNTSDNENCAMVTPDGKYLFFTRAGDIYWVDARIIAEYRAALDAAPAPAVPEAWKTLGGETRTPAQAESFLLDLMKTSKVTALSVAVVQNDRVVFDRILGVVERKTGKPADSQTVLRAASLSKPVFSYLVMKMVDEGLLSLDQPLAEFIDPPFTAYPEYASLKNDARSEALTAAILLTHSAGFPNWRRPRFTGSLGIQFNPGEAFSYSGEGYYLLQFLLEKKTGRDLNALAKEKVFGPLGMTRSAFLWEARFDGDFAVDLDSGLGPLIQRSRTNANSAGSLLTNASDYAKFMLAALGGRGLKPETASAWRKPRLRVTGKALHSREKPDTSLNDDIQLSWTPGWGWFRSPAGEALFHLGMEEGCENYVVLFPEKKTGIVVQSVSDLSVRISPSIVARLIGDVYSPFSWMRY